MTRRRTFTAEQLREIITYDAATGIFVWLPRKGRPNFNGQYAGKEAGPVSGNGSGNTYKSISAFGQRYKAHILAYLYMTGKWPAAYIDHIDRNGLNNSWANLRLATAMQNAANAKRYSSNTSGLKGVSYSSTHGKWRAMYSRYWLGHYDTKEEAHEAYLAKARELHGTFARSE